MTGCSRRPDTMSSSANDLITRLQAQHAAVAANLSPGGSDGRRAHAVAQLTAEGLPDNRDENWRYANLRALARVSFVAPPAANIVTSNDLPAALEGYLRYVFVDGQFAASLSANLQHGIQTGVTRPIAALDKLAAREARFAVVSDAFAVDGLTVDVNKTGTSNVAPRVEVLFVTSSESTVGSSYPRLKINIGAGAHLHLVERHLSVGTAAAMVNSVIDVQLAQAAALEHVRVQQLGARCVSIDTLDARLHAEARYHLHCIATGASAARSTLQIALAGQQSRLELVVGCVATANQTLDTYALVDHAAPGASTHELFRGIASGRSRVAFNGKMIVRQNARGADSQQLLKGLLAGTDAEIDVRPQLEIYTDEVSASHGATTGKLDETMLFYLLSRGIDREMAHSLLKWAFIEDALKGVRPEALRRSIESDLSGQFQEIAALDGLLGDLT